MSHRDTILNAQDIRSETITVDAWDGAKIMMRGMTALQRGRLVDTVNDRAYMSVDIVMELGFDPDTGERMFDPADRDALAAKSGAVLDMLATKAIQLSGVDVDAAEAEVDADPT